MSRIESFPLGREEGLSPFDEHPRLAGGGALFVHLSGRGQTSPLLVGVAEEETLRVAVESIPMGSTDLWILEWLGAVAPRLGARVRPSQRRAAAALTAGPVVPGRSYLLVGEDGRWHGATDDVQSARAAARAIVGARPTRIAIGRLRAAHAWH